MLVQDTTAENEALIKLLSSTARIFGSEASVSPQSIWVTGTGLNSHKRDLMITLEKLDFERTMLSVTITDDNIGKSIYVMLGYVDIMDSSSFASLVCWVIERIMDGGGSAVKVLE